MMNEQFKYSLVKTLIPHIALKVTEERHIHGYGLIDLIRKTMGCYYSPSTVYPILVNMEKEGFISSTWNTTMKRPRKEYTITEKGKRRLLDEDAVLSIFPTKFGIKIGIIPRVTVET